MALSVSILPGGATPIYRQIIDQVRQGMVSGELREGDGLPSVRALAEQLVANPNTAARAYGELVRDGALEAVPGKGVAVGKRRQVFTKAERMRRLEATLAALVSEGLYLGFEPDEIRAAVDRRLDEVSKSAAR